MDGGYIEDQVEYDEETTYASTSEVLQAENVGANDAGYLPESEQYNNQ